MKKYTTTLAAIVLTAMLSIGVSCNKEDKPSNDNVITVPEGAINGLFTINDNGDQVYFSKGNLQYHAINNTWQFAENQWDFIGKSNANISSDYDGWIDLFGWGTSGYDHGAICYQPWSISESDGNYNAYGCNSCHLYDQTGQADWGYNCISNGGNQEGQWRTLTGGDHGEWSYLIDNRSTQSGIRFVKAQVNETNGLILFPDNWNNTTFTLNTTNDYESPYSNNIISTNQWATLFEAAGCVFLPAAGSRFAITLVGNVGKNGVYWSSSSADEYNVYYLTFSDVYLYPASIYYPYYGFSVRLVHDLAK